VAAGREGRVRPRPANRFFANAEDTALVVEVTLHWSRKPLLGSTLARFAEALRAALPGRGHRDLSPVAGTLVWEDVPAALQPLFCEPALTCNTRTAHCRVSRLVLPINTFSLTAWWNW
jgi:hypothetical protein